MESLWAKWHYYCNYYTAEPGKITMRFSDSAADLYSCLLKANYKYCISFKEVSVKKAPEALKACEGKLGVTVI